LVMMWAARALVGMRWIHWMVTRGRVSRCGEQSLLTCAKAAYMMTMITRLGDMSLSQ
jgi:hypothetical protein